MSRTLVSIRPVRPEELPALDPLWAELEQMYEPGVARGAATALDRLHSLVAAADPLLEPATGVGTRVLGAWDGIEPVGILVVTASDFAPWYDGLAIIVNLLMVRSTAQQHGIGRQLLQEVLTIADELGARDIAVDVPPNNRDAHRFYAKLGFAPVTTRRAAGVSALRRKLAGEQPGRLSELRTRTSVRRRLLKAKARTAAPQAPVPVMTRDAT